jgi:hypothetical protein
MTHLLYVKVRTTNDIFRLNLPIIKIVEVLALWLSEVSPYKRSPVQDHQAIMIGRLIVILI